MVSPLQSIAANLRPGQNPAMQIGDIISRGRIQESNLANQALNRQNVQQQMQNRQQAMSQEQALGAARYINAFGKQWLNAPPEMRQQLTQSNLPQLQSLGYTPEILQNMTEDEVRNAVMQTEPLAGGKPASPKVLGEGEILVDPTTGRTIAEGGEKEVKDQPMVDKLRSRYDTYTKDLRQVDAAYRKVNNAPQTAPGDMSLIFGFMKILDPGSTVREGEFASAEQAAGVPTRIVNLYNRALSGERLSPEQRAEFKNTAKQTFEAQRESADVQIATLLQQADQDGISRVRVLGAENLREFEKRAADRLINQLSDSSSNKDPLLIEAEAAIAAGADRNAVMQRYNQMKASQ